MLTFPPTHAHVQAPTAQVCRQDAPVRRSSCADRGDYVVGVINGHVVTSPRHAVSLSEDGSITIPLLDEFA